MARQGNGFATAQALRVVYPPRDDTDELVDVPRDGKTVGEITMRGNTVMQGVSAGVFEYLKSLLTCGWFLPSIIGTLKPHRRHFAEEAFALVILR
jgi:hypothetical protein